MSEKEFLEFHSGYYGELVNHLGQIVTTSFSGEELFEYINTLLEQQQNKQKL